MGGILAPPAWAGPSATDPSQRPGAGLVAACSPSCSFTAASYAEIPDAGHMMMLEAPERFGVALARLLNT